MKWKPGIYDRVISGSGADELCRTIAEHLEAKPGRKYWKDAANATEAATDANGTTVSINQRGVRLHFYGGTVRPSGRISNVTGKPIKRLLIPTEDSPLRKTRSELYELGLDPESVHVAGGRLIADMGGVPVVLGLLARQTVHEPDPSVLPTTAEMEQALHDGAAKSLRLLNL